MSNEVKDLFGTLCDCSDHFVDPGPWDDYYIPEDESYDDFLFAGSNLYGGY